MELASLFLLVLLPPADATGDTAVAVEASLRHELGDVAMVLAPDSLVTPAMWQGEKAQMRARFVAHLMWKQKDQASVELAWLASTASGHGRRSTRELTFAPQDSRSERGRAIGLVVAELLRESPSSAWAETKMGLAASLDGPSYLVLGGMFAAERARSGNWALGPELTYDFGLVDGLRLQALGTALFSSTDQYSEIGLGVGIAWDFLRSEHGRHALGVGLEGGVRHESASRASDNTSSDSRWDMALGASLSGRLTVWRSLRLIGEFDVSALSGTVALTVGENAGRRTYSFSRWRPAFALGLQLAL
jgi:hypothetical protein